MSFIQIRNSDSAVIGHTMHESGIESPNYEIEKGTPPKFKPSFTIKKWTYDSETEEFTNTNEDMTW